MSESYQQYLAELRQLPAMGTDEDLDRDYFLWTFKADRGAHDRLIHGLLPLVPAIVAREVSQKWSFLREDLVGAGNEELIRAMRKFRLPPDGAQGLSDSLRGWISFKVGHAIRSELSRLISEYRGPDWDSLPVGTPEEDEMLAKLTGIVDNEDNAVLEQEVLLDQLEAAVEKLPERQQMLVRLVLQDRSPSAAGAVLGISRKSALQLWHRALKALKQDLSEGQE